LYLCVYSSHKSGFVALAPFNDDAKTCEPACKAGETGHKHLIQLKVATCSLSPKVNLICQIKKRNLLSPPKATPAVAAHECLTLVPCTALFASELGIVDSHPSTINTCIKFFGCRKEKKDGFVAIDEQNVFPKQLFTHD